MAGPSSDRAASVTTRGPVEASTGPGWLAEHAVDLAFALLAIGWFGYVIRITRSFSFWSDDLLLTEQAGSLRGLLEPYNGHLSVVILAIYRGAAEAVGLEYGPIMAAGALSLVLVPVTYYVTTRRPLGPPLAAVLALPLLWYQGTNLQPSALNHYLALVGGIVAAAALNRGRRADGVLAGAVALSLCSAGGGVVVAGACLLHNALVRPHHRRWWAVLVPLALWAAWWILAADASTVSAAYRLSGADAVRVVRDLFLSPFYAAAFDIRPLAYLLMAAFVLVGVAQLRHGLVAGANFVAWTAAMVAWAVALVRSRGIFADADTFRYAYLSMGFALLAVVPRHPLRYPSGLPARSSRGLAVAAAVVVLVLGAGRALVVRDGLQDDARGRAERGREASGTLLVLDLGQDAIPDDTRISFYGLLGSRGTAAELRVLADRYGSPFDTTAAGADQHLVDMGIARIWVGGTQAHPGCEPLGGPLPTPGVPDHGKPSVGAAPVQLWSAAPFTVEVRRFGREWAPLATVAAGRNITLTLPVLNSRTPWEVRADGACVVGPRETS